MWLVSVLFGLAHATCPSGVSSSDLETTLEAAEQQFVDFDESGFKATVVELAGFQLPCLSEVLPTQTVAHYHRVIGIHRFILGDEAGSGLAFMAAKRLDPKFEFTDDLFSSDHPIRDAYQAYPTEARLRRTRVPEDGSLSFDGVIGGQRPHDLPTLTQLVDANGLPVWTTYVGAGGSLPEFRAVPKLRTGLLGCAGGSAVVGGGFLGGALARRGALQSLALDPTVPAADLNAIRGQVQGLGAVGAALTGVAIGCGGSAVAVGRR